MFIYCNAQIKLLDKTKHHGAEHKKELDILISKIGALEASTTDREKKALMGMLAVIVENQKHFVDESEHLKKALDLLTAQLFKMDQTKK